MFQNYMDLKASNIDIDDFERLKRLQNHIYVIWANFEYKGSKFRTIIACEDAI